MTGTEHSIPGDGLRRTAGKKTEIPEGVPQKMAGEGLSISEALPRERPGEDPGISGMPAQEKAGEGLSISEALPRERPGEDPGISEVPAQEKAEEELSISEMLPQDAVEVAALERIIFTMPWSENGFLTSLQSPDTLYLIARVGGRIAGYCGFLQSFDEADITNVAVAPDFRGRGIGTRMLRELMARGRERGVSRYTLEVRQSNEAAIRLYRKLGFSSVGIRKNFYEKPREHALIMWTE